MQEKQLMLGTAQWGWTVDRHTAFSILDAWLSAGHRALDGATNYPINRNPGDFRSAEYMLAEYIRAQGIQDLDLTMKIGSMDNMRSPDVNLSPSFIQMMSEEYLRIFGKNLGCIMLHWDNRADLADIQASLEALQQLQQRYGIRVGVSGLKHPETYAEANEKWGLTFDIQLKHNILHSDLRKYAPLQAATPRHRFFAYGINAGGLKLASGYHSDSTFLARGGQPEQARQVADKLLAALPDWNTAFVRPPVKTMNHIGLLYAGLHPGLDGLLLGVSSVAQLRESLDFWRNLPVFDYQDVFKILRDKIAIT